MNISVCSICENGKLCKHECVFIVIVLELYVCVCVNSDLRTTRLMKRGSCVRNVSVHILLFHIHVPHVLMEDSYRRHTR